jgi:hypothetical protein
VNLAQGIDGSPLIYAQNADVHDLEGGKKKKRANRYRTKIYAGSVSAHLGLTLRSTTKIRFSEWFILERHFPRWMPFSTAGSQLIS